MVYTYVTSGVCSRSINIDIDDVSGAINDIMFIGGCNGNLQGISAFSKGMMPADVIKKLKGIRCGFKSTSCPDQLAIALEKIERNELNGI